MGRSVGRSDAPSNLGQTVTGGDDDKPLRTDDVYIVTVPYVNSTNEQTSTSAAIVAYPRRLQLADGVAQPAPWYLCEFLHTVLSDCVPDDEKLLR